MLRPFTNKRSRGIGLLRPSVILYGEPHPFAEAIGQVTMHDLNYAYERSLMDDNVVVLVAGTSLQIPGVKTMVRRFTEVIRSSTDMDSILVDGVKTGEGSNATSFRSIYLNLDFPSSDRKWSGIFDAWVYGDLQHFAQLVLESISNENEECV
jgi:NAD-dependent SIR2 family protein deacetylase